jgi:hypothetical protein
MERYVMRNAGFSHEMLQIVMCLSSFESGLEGGFENVMLYDVAKGLLNDLGRLG